MSVELRGLTARTLGCPAIYWPSIDSTNQWLKQNGANLPHGTLCWTRWQTAGRGRLGRTWCAEDGQTLAMSLLFKPATEIALLPLIAGMAVSKALGELVDAPFLMKWPNDIVCNGRKICGILCENCLSSDGDHGSFAVAGIGVNLLQSAEMFEHAGLPHAGSLQMITDCVPDGEQTAAAIVNALEPLWLTLQEQGFRALRAEYEARCLNIGRMVRVLSPTGRVLREGLAVGIANDGCLLVDSGSGPVSVNAGEVSVRGLQDYV